MAKASQVVLLENEFYLIKAPNGKVLEIKNFNTENGAAIRLWDYAGHPWQQWQFVDAGEGRWRIRNRFTGKFIDLALGGVVEGTWLHQWGRTSPLWDAFIVSYFRAARPFPALFSFRTRSFWCLLREVQEETGLTLTSYRCRGVVTFLLGELTEYMFLYTADAWTGTLVKDAARNEGILEWVPKEQVEQLPIWEGDKIFFRLLEEDRPFFSLKLRYEDDTLAEAVLDGKPL